MQTRSGSLPPTNPSADRQWYIVARWQEISGEARANLLRIVAIGVFYSIELASHYGLPMGWLDLTPAVDQASHEIITAIAVAWTMVALAVYFMLHEQKFPRGLKYVTTGCDIVLLTTILTAAHGPRSAMVVGYFLIIALAGLRFELRLVWCATIGCILGYAFLLGYSRWFAAEPLRADMTVTRYQQLIVLAAMITQGVVVGQVVRLARTMAVDYASRLGRTQEVR